MQIESMLSWGMSVVFILFLVLIYIKKADRDEPFLGWKLVGYFFLGTFTLRLESWILPLGIAVFLIFFLPKIITNKQSKKWAASLGVVSFASSLIISHSVEAYYEGMIHIKAASDNAYEMNFLKEYEKVKAALGAEGELAINNLELSFEKDGKIQQLTYEAVYTRDNRNMSAWITLLDAQYQVVTHIVENETEMMNYQNYISTPNVYFKTIDLHGLKEMVAKGDLYVVSFTNSDEVPFDVEDGSFWDIERAGVQKHTKAAATDENANSEEEMDPQFSYQISITTMNAMGAGSYESDQQRYFAISPELYN